VYGYTSGLFNTYQAERGPDGQCAISGGFKRKLFGKYYKFPYLHRLKWIEV
jgi:hypothetical protein